MPDGRYAVDVPPANGNSVAANAGEKSSGATKLTALPWGSLLPQSLELTLPAYPRSGTFGSRTAPTDAEWRIVNGTRYKFFVYSAFYDRRAGGRLVRVIGATKTRGPEKVWCRLWYAAADNGTGAGAVTSTSVVARVKVIRENWNLKYSACFVLCPLTATTATTTTEALPFAVSVVSKLRSPPSNVLRLHNGELEAAKRAEAAMSLGNATTTATDQTLMGGGGHAYRDAMAGQAGSGRANFIPPDSIAICIKPLHFDYDSVSDRSIARFLPFQNNYWKTCSISNFSMKFSNGASCPPHRLSICSNFSSSTRCWAYRISRCTITRWAVGPHAF